VSDPIEQHQVLLALYAINGLVWVGAALSAYVGFRAFRQRADVQWAIAFVLMAAVFFGHAYVAYRWVETLRLAEEPARIAADVAVYYQLRLAGVALAPSFLVFYLFRKRRPTT
jgi:hypothetical protein